MTRQNISGSSPYESKVGFSRAVRIGGRVLVSGTAPIFEEGTCDPDPYVQAKRCLEIIEGALAQAGATMQDVVRTRTYLVRASDWVAVSKAHGEVFFQVRPASTMVVVKELLDPDWKVEIEAEALIS